VNTQNKITRTKTHLTFKDEEGSAQIIDGQHRVAGIEAAIEDDPKLGKLELPVVIFENLTTKMCADIFLSINTEQKPVPRSLVFDLYGEASVHIVDPAAVRARDIAIYLNETDNSPYFGEIKFPGDPPRRGGISLSTVVTAIKPLVEDKGVFEQIDVRELEMQRKIIFNLLTVLKKKYGEKWAARENVFMFAAGFMGAMDFLKLKLITYCNNKGSFTDATIAAALSLDPSNLILQDETKGMGGNDAAKLVYDRLVEVFKAGGKSKLKLEV
jgi:DGQHR domain-containing protein